MKHMTYLLIMLPLAAAACGHGTSVVPADDVEATSHVVQQVQQNLVQSMASTTSSDECWLACYKHQPGAKGFDGTDVVAVGAFRTKGTSDAAGICRPAGFATADISKEQTFVDACTAKIPSCASGGCWAGGQTASQPPQPSAAPPSASLDPVVIRSASFVHGKPFHPAKAFFQRTKSAFGDREGLTLMLGGECPDGLHNLQGQMVVIGVAANKPGPLTRSDYYVVQAGLGTPPGARRAVGETFSREEENGRWAAFPSELVAGAVSIEGFSDDGTLFVGTVSVHDDQGGVVDAVVRAANCPNWDD